jgi:hypothetical protein
MNWGIFWIGVLTLVYFLPAVVSIARRHRNALAITFTNAAFGWTGLVWAACLVWSLTCNVRKHG